MKKLLLALSTLILCSQSHSTVFWSVKATGIHTTTDGTAAINIGSSEPVAPNPSETVWAACHQNFIYFHKKADGELVSDAYVNRMLSVAMGAFKTDSWIRVGLNRSESGRCYTSQIFDNGN